MNSIPAASNEALMAFRLWSTGRDRPLSKFRTVDMPTFDRAARSNCDQPIKALAARHCAGVILKRLGSSGARAAPARICAPVSINTFAPPLAAIRADHGPSTQSSQAKVAMGGR